MAWDGVGWPWDAVGWPWDGVGGRVRGVRRAWRAADHACSAPMSRRPGHRKLPTPSSSPLWPHRRSRAPPWSFTFVQILMITLDYSKVKTWFGSHSLCDRNLRDCKFISFTGPKLPMSILRHAMIQLEKGQAIIGGYGNGNIQEKIYLFSCLARNCSIHQLNPGFSVPRYLFVAIPIPDSLSGCITGGKILQKKTIWLTCNWKPTQICFFRMSVSGSCWRRLLPWLDQ